MTDCEPGLPPIINTELESVEFESVPEDELSVTGVASILETKLTYIDTEEVGIEWLNESRIAERLGIYERWVCRKVAALGIPSEMRIYRGTSIPHFPPYTTAVLKEELIWRETYRSLPKYLSFTEISELIGRSTGWTRKTMEEIGIRPVKSKAADVTKPDRTGVGFQVDGAYPKTVLGRLREISMAVPMDDGWLTPGRIAVALGMEREWVVRRLEEGGYGAQKRRSSSTGRIWDHYPPEALKHLTQQHSNRPEYGGAWMSLHAIAASLDRNENWVRRRLGEHTGTAEIRQDDHGVPRLHYPPCIVRKLAEESEYQKNLPPAGDYISLKTLCRASGHTYETTESILDELGITPELRRDGKGRARGYFPLETIERIRAFDSNHEPSATTKVIEATFAVGSLRSRIRAIRKQLNVLAGYPDSADQNQINSLREELSQNNTELKKALSRYYRLV